MSLALPITHLIKHTTSLCPRCRQSIAACVYESNNRIFLRKICPEHGRFDILINSDRELYHLSVGTGGCCDGANRGDETEARSHEPHGVRTARNVNTLFRGRGRGHDPSIIERASTCIALIEIVDSCNLKCPTCYADSPFRPPEDIQFLCFDTFRERIDRVLARKKEIDILQLSGGEPSIHPQFFELFEHALNDPRIGYILLNTNGLRLAQDDAFVRRLGELHRRLRGFEIYLQFDGPQPAGQRELRGTDLRSIRVQAIRRTGAFDIPTTLAMTVNDANAAHLGDTIRFGLTQPSVRGVCFQPMFHSGRTPVEGNIAPPRRLNAADIQHALIAQSGGLLRPGDFTPLPCGDPNCHTIGYLVRDNGRTRGISKLVDFSKVQSFLKNRVNFNMEDLARCGCESEPLGRMLKALEIGPDDVFRLFIKPFMDTWTYDQDRIDRCCVHVVTEHGELESFCRYYAMKT